MKRKIPTFKTDAQAERFVANSDLTRYDLSGGKAVQFEFEPKASQLNMRLPASLLNAVRHRAEQWGIPYTRFVREVLEHSLQEEGPARAVRGVIKHLSSTKPVYRTSAVSRNELERQHILQKSGLDGRHRDKNPPKAGGIQQKRSDTLNKNLSKPIPQFSPNTTLGTMREKTGKASEDAVRRAAAKMYKKS